MEEDCDGKKPLYSKYPSHLIHHLFQFADDDVFETPTTVQHSNSNNISSSIQSISSNGHVSNHFSGNHNTVDPRGGPQHLPSPSNQNHSTYMAGPAPKENGTDMSAGENSMQYDRVQTPGTPGGPGSSGPSASCGSGGSNNLTVGNVMIPSSLLPVKVETAAEIQAAAKRRTQSCSAIQQMANNSQLEPQSPISKVCAKLLKTQGEKLCRVPENTCDLLTYIIIP